MKIIIKIKTHPGTSQWLGLHFPNARGAGWIPGRGARIPHASQPKYQNIIQFSSVTQSCPPNELQHTRPPCPSPTPGVPPNPCLSSRWCHPTISSSAVPFSSCPQSFQSFTVSQFFTLGGPSIGVSASTSVLPMNTQDWSPLGWNGWISLQSKGLSRVFSNTTVQKHQFSCAQLSL